MSGWWWPTVHGLELASPVHVSIVTLTLLGLIFVLCLAELHAPRR